MERFGKDQARMIVEAIREVPRAVIDYSSQNQPDLFKAITIDLSEERTDSTPLELGFVFMSAYVELASDSLAYCVLKPNANRDGMIGARLSKNGVLNFENPVRGLSITNPAQSGKTMTIKFFLYSNYQPGSIDLDVNSSVNNISVGGAIVSNASPFIHMSGSLTLTALADASMQYTAMVAKNVVSTYVSSTNLFAPPEGYEAVIVGMEVYNYDAMTGARFSINVGIGELLDAAVNAAVITYANRALNFSKLHLIGSNPYIFDKNEIGLNAANPLRIQNVVDDAIPVTEFFVCDSGKRPAFFVTNNSGAPVTGLMNFEVVGYLREVQ